MVEFRKTKRLSRSFGRIRIDESALARLSTRIRDLTSGHGGSLNIEIVSADNQDTIRTSDPEFFLTDNMPRKIRSVSISYLNYQGALSCELELRADPIEPAKLRMDGTDPAAVSGAYHELERELSERQVTGGALLAKLDTFAAFLFLGILAAACIYSAFDIALYIADLWIQGFKASTVRRGIVVVGGIFTFIAFFGGFRLVELLKETFPLVEFAGRLSDPSTNRRSRLVWVAVSILLPILLNVLSGMLTGLFRR